MPQIHPILTNFTGGELSSRLYGRVDLAKYGDAARILENMIVMPHGGVRKRGGTKFIATTKDNNTTARLVEFIFSTTQAYMLEFGANYIRFYREGGQIYDLQYTVTGVTRGNPTTITLSTTQTLVANDRVVLTGIGGTVELNNRECSVVGAAGQTITVNIDSTNYGAYTSGGQVSRIYEIYTVYSAADVPMLTFTQNSNTLFIFHEDWPIAKLVRAGHASWTHQWATVEEGPFLDINAGTTTLSVDVASGQGIMTASAALFESSHVGGIWRIWEKSNGSTFGYARWSPGAGDTVANGSFWEYSGNVYYVVSGGGGTLQSTAAYPTHTSGTVDVFYGGGTAQMRYEHSGWAVVRIDSIVSSQNANVTVVKNRVPYSAYGARSTLQWQEGAWSDKRGYVTAGSFFQQRFFVASTPNQPSTIWGSRTGIYLNFRDGKVDDDSFSYTIAGGDQGQVDVIKYLSAGKQMAVLTTSSEYIMQASRSDEAITPTNVKISRETTYGTALLRPLRIGPVVLFGQRAGKNTSLPRKIREFVYNFQTDTYLAPDMTILSEHVTLGGILNGAFQMTPDMVLWFARNDGVLVALTYERDQKVTAWHRHIVAGGGKIKQLASIPGDNDDELWAIVERTIQSSTRRYIEVLQRGLPDDGLLEDSFFIDSGLSYSGSAATIISGLFHLEGQTITALADGKPYYNLVVSGGKITLPVSAVKVHAGYQIFSTVSTLRLESGAAGGSAQGRIGRIWEIVARFERSVGGSYGPTISKQTGIPYREPLDPLPSRLELFSGDKMLPFEGEWDRDRYVTFKHSDPLPFTISALMPSIHVSG